jgi:hypothetical protein
MRTRFTLKKGTHCDDTAFTDQLKRELKVTFGDDKEVTGDDTELVEEDLVVLGGILDKEGWVVREKGVDTFDFFLGLCFNHWGNSMWLLCQCWCVAYLALYLL